VAASGGQGPAPPFVGFTNGAGAPPPAGGRGRGIPPRTQSAPPNLKEQKQAAIFIPARATPNPAAFPGAPYYVRSESLICSFHLSLSRYAKIGQFSSIAIYSPLLVRPTTRSLLLACSLE
jgi:hypothetical protein